MHDVIELVLHALDVRDEDHLLEAILQPAEQLHHVVSPVDRRAIRRLRRGRAARTTWPDRSAIIWEMARRSTRFERSSSPPEITGFGNSVLEHDQVVLVVELEFRVAPIA